MAALLAAPSCRRGAACGAFKPLSASPTLLLAENATCRSAVLLVAACLLIYCTKRACTPSSPHGSAILFRLLPGDGYIYRDAVGKTRIWRHLFRLSQMRDLRDWASGRQNNGIYRVRRCPAFALLLLRIGDDRRASHRIPGLPSHLPYATEAALLRIICRRRRWRSALRKDLWIAFWWAWQNRSA
jgi:hypothetical protein